MDQYTNYLNTLPRPMYPHQINTTSTFLSPESQPPSLSASPVSSEGSDSLIDQTVQYGIFGYDQSPTALFSLANNFMCAESTPVNGHSDFGYDPHMMFDRGFAHSAPIYQHPIDFDYPAHPDTVSSLTNLLADSAPFATVAPSATSGPSEEEVSPASSPFLYAEVDSPIHAPAVEVDSPIHAPIVESDYSPSGESEIEDEEPSNRRKNRSARVSFAAHPYLKSVSKGKDKKVRGARVEIPVPVPGLTKSSRGRSVPKKSEAVYEEGARGFWCSVENCDKVFSRGEHLKRHITSIHTDNKRE